MTCAPLDCRGAPASGDVTFVPALAGLAAPWWRSEARGAFSGLSLATSRGQLVCAVVEGIAATVAALVAVIGDDTGTPPEALRVDGGLTHSAALMQAQADICRFRSRSIRRRTRRRSALPPWPASPSTDGNTG